MNAEWSKLISHDNSEIFWIIKKNDLSNEYAILKKPSGNVLSNRKFLEMFTAESDNDAIKKGNALAPKYDLLP
jgi:hypothetical protein